MWRNSNFYKSPITFASGSKFYGTTHAGSLSSKILKSGLLKETDCTGKHLIATASFCKVENCSQIRCDQQVENCKATTRIENSTTLPKTGGIDDFKTYLLGNFSHSAPDTDRFDAITINAQVDYNNQTKEQQFVVEDIPVEVDAKEVLVNKKATRYIQKEQNNSALLNSTTRAGNKSISERLKEIRNVDI